MSRRRRCFIRPIGRGAGVHAAESPQFRSTPDAAAAHRRVRRARAACRLCLRCAPFMPDQFYEELGRGTFAGLTRQHTDAVVDFVATGGYALRLAATAKIRDQQGQPLPRRPSRALPAISAQCRHHRRRDHDQGPAGRSGSDRPSAGRPARSPSPASWAEFEDAHQGLHARSHLRVLGESLRLPRHSSTRLCVARALQRSPDRLVQRQKPCSTCLAAQLQALITTARLAGAARASARKSARRIPAMGAPHAAAGPTIVERFPRQRGLSVVYPFEGRLRPPSASACCSPSGSNARACARSASSAQRWRRIWGSAIQAFTIRERTISLASTRTCSATI